jgi:tripartite-type tricarboxylate transporter receptor subunit TctC
LATKISLRLLLSICALLNSVMAQAQGWPTKPVRIVIGAPAGAAPDIAARILGEKLTAAWGQPVLVDNRPGAGGMIAMENLRASPADGHTLMFAHAGAIVVSPKLFKMIKYDPVADFTVVGLAVDSPMMIVAAADNPKSRIADLVAAAKADPGGVAVGSTEQATLPFMVGHLLADQTGVKFLHVPFAQPNLGIQALVKGDLKYYVDGIAPLLPQITAGRLKAVAISADRELPGLQGIPMLSETVPGFVAVGWFAMLGPKGLPEEITTRINRDLVQALASADVAARLQTLSMFANPKSPADSLTFLKREVERWGAVINKIGLQPQ